MRRRCTARSKQSGDRCRQAPIVGGTVCRFHGGAAPQVQASARERIAALVDPAIDALQRALKHRDIGAAVRAARDLLDRAGYAAARAIELRGATLEDIIAGSYQPAEGSAAFADVCRAPAPESSAAAQDPGGGGDGDGSEGTERRAAPVDSVDSVDTRAARDRVPPFPYCQPGASADSVPTRPEGAASGDQDVLRVDERPLTWPRPRRRD